MANLGRRVYLANYLPDVQMDQRIDQRFNQRFDYSHDDMVTLRCHDGDVVAFRSILRQRFLTMGDFIMVYPDVTEIDLDVSAAGLRSLFHLLDIGHIDPVTGPEWLDLLQATAYMNLNPELYDVTSQGLIDAGSAAFARFFEQESGDDFMYYLGDLNPDVATLHDLIMAYRDLYVR